MIQSKIDTLYTTIAINASNATIVACWDLEPPSTREKKQILRPAVSRLPESVNPKGDHRIKVSKANIVPDGKYGAICKLFMCYRGDHDSEFMGTGWLINPNLIVTAGHCSVDNGQGLRYIKVYFGYHGPESVGAADVTYRYGTRVAVPAEYIKASTATHDVSFIVLNKTVKNIKPITYKSTPIVKTPARMGIVGYPGDLDSGHFMYQEWISAKIDLASTNGLLSYEIDTAGGQSGSPVLMGDMSTAVGVHVQGGFPNIGSVIGPAGNKFGEYILALKVIDGEKSHIAAIVDIQTQRALSAPNFSLVRVEPGALKENAENGNNLIDLTGDASASDKSEENSSDDDHNSDSDSDSESNVDIKENTRAPIDESPFEKQINDLWGRVSKKHKKEFRRSRVMLFPESLVLNEAETVAPPTTDQMVAAAKKAAYDPDVQTTFFIGFPPGDLNAKETKSLQKVVSMVQSWQAWSSSVCEGKVQQQVDKKVLSAETEGQFARSTYRAKVFDYLFRQSTWFAKTFDQNMTKHIECQKADFHTAILKAVLEGFSIPFAAYLQLEKVLNTIGENITLSRTKIPEKQQYWLMLTRYNWQPLIKTAQPVIRVISFSVDHKMREYTAGKSSFTSVSIDLQFGQYQSDFIVDIYKKIRSKIDNKLVEAGTDLVARNTFDIPI